MLVAGTNAKVQYAGTFLGALGIYPCIANTISWVSNNTEGVYKRGITLGFVIGWGNLNGVVSSNIYIKGDPGYRKGHGIVLAYLVLFLTGGSTILHFLLQRENARRRAGALDHIVQGKSKEEIEALGDVRYVIIITSLRPGCGLAEVANIKRRAGLGSTTPPEACERVFVISTVIRL